MATPDEILALSYASVSGRLEQPSIDDAEVVSNVEYVCRNSTKAGTRFLLAAALAKIHRPEVDIRKPYTEIGGEDTYSGRTYDERYITAFIQEHSLPANHTTAFLTPAFRNRNATLTPDVEMVGRPRRLYQTLLLLLDEVHTNAITAESLLNELIRWLLVIRDEQEQRIESIKANLRTRSDDLPLSSEAIVKLIRQHLEQPRSSRLPVLVVAAAYRTVSTYIGEAILPLEAHNAADSQTGALGDLQIALLDDSSIVTCYEMKTRRVSQTDIDHALAKLSSLQHRVDNYIFITTEPIDQGVQDYAASIYTETDGIEVVVLDCIDFLRHFLHLFHRLRVDFLNTYQTMVLEEPESAVSHALKEVFLALRLAAENRE